MPSVNMGCVSSGFGYRHDGFHPGVDLAAPNGSPVRAAGAGRVVFAGWYGEYGKIVDIRSTDGLLTRYAHLSQIGNKVGPGRAVSKGETIGNIGATGSAHGAHLYFEVRRSGKPVDPMTYLASSGTFATPPMGRPKAATTPSGHFVRNQHGHAVGLRGVRHR